MIVYRILIKKTDITDVSIFSFYCYFIREAPTGSNGRSAKKKGLFFALWKNDITVVSLFASCCCFIEEARHRFRRKEINSLAQQTICLITYFEWADADEEVVMCLLKKVSVIFAGVCCLNERFFVASCLSTRKRKRIQNNVDNKVH